MTVATRSTKRTHRRSTWPTPTTDMPDFETVEEWFWDGVAEATDGCLVEPDGVCPHGHPSWLIVLGVM